MAKLLLALVGKNLQILSGHAAIHHRRKQFVVDNVADGFDLHQLDNAGFVRTFPTGPPRRPRSRQVGFAEDGKVIIAGSDCGVVFVFDRKTSAQLDVLHHTRDGAVQTVTVSDKQCALQLSLMNCQVARPGNQNDCCRCLLHPWLCKLYNRLGVFAQAAPGAGG